MFLDEVVSTRFRGYNYFQFVDDIRWYSPIPWFQFCVIIEGGKQWFLRKRRRLQPIALVYVRERGKYNKKLRFAASRERERETKPIFLVRGHSILTASRHICGSSSSNAKQETSFDEILMIIQCFLGGHVSKMYISSSTLGERLSLIIFILIRNVQDSKHQFALILPNIFCSLTKSREEQLNRVPCNSKLPIGPKKHQNMNKKGIKYGGYDGFVGYTVQGCLIF